LFSPDFLRADVPEVPPMRFAFCHRLASIMSIKVECHRRGRMPQDPPHEVALLTERRSWTNRCAILATETTSPTVLAPALLVAVALDQWSERGAASMGRPPRERSVD